MKITMNLKTFKKYMKMFNEFSNQTSILQYEKTVYIYTKNRKINIKCLDSLALVNMEFNDNYDIEEEGFCIINTELLHKCVHNQNGDNVTLVSSEKIIKIYIDNIEKYKLSLIPIYFKEVTTMPTDKDIENKYLEIDLQEFIKGIEYLKPFMLTTGISSNSYILNGINLSAGKENLFMYATDKVYISKYKIPMKNNKELLLNCVLSETTLNKLKYVIDSENQVKIGLHNECLVISFENGFISLYTVHGEFPNIYDFYNIQYPYSYEFDTKEFLNILKKLEILHTYNTNNGLYLVLKKDNSYIKFINATNNYIGLETIKTINCNTDIELFLMVNIKKLIDIVSKLKNDTIVFKFEEFKYEYYNNKININDTSILMPMRSLLTKKEVLGDV